jgi:hypothetical protein
MGTPVPTGIQGHRHLNTKTFNYDASMNTCESIADFDTPDALLHKSLQTTTV